MLPRFDPAIPGLPDLKHIHLFDVSGCGFSVTNYGARLTDLRVPGRDGLPVSVILGFPSLKDYLEDDMCFGAIIGPVAGRIPGAKAFVDGHRYEFLPNDGPNLLHSGEAGFQHKTWELIEVSEAPMSVTLRHSSPDEEGGFPGNLDVVVVYRYDSPGIFSVEIQGETDAPTPFSPTNHAYFNLAGDTMSTVDSHRLTINGEIFTPFDSTGALTGERLPVNGQAADCRKETPVGEFINRQKNRHGENYVLSHKGREPKLAAVLIELESGLRMAVETTAACLQFFGGQYIPAGLKDRRGRAIPPRGGLCLECQEAPDGATHPSAGSIILRPLENYLQRTIWRFGFS